jgi:glucose/arabinose dehydrogenase
MSRIYPYAGPARAPKAGAFAIAAVFAAAAAVAPYAQLPANFEERTIAAKAGFNEATSMAHADDGRIFVSERSGNIKVIKGDEAPVVYKISTNIGREQGLLKIQAHPGFAAKSWIYAFHITADNHHHNVTRIKLDNQSNVVGVDTVIKLPVLENGGRHNGSGMVFGKDGLLYVARGQDELGGASNPAAVWTSQKGKILRFTAEGQPAPGNPHYATGATNEEKSVWARGFRNPWTMAVDPISGRIFVGDVGDGSEEVNDVTSPDPAKGHWYGYGVGGGDGVRNKADMIDPIYYHATGASGECAIVAEAPYNAAQASNWPAQYKNRLYVADYCGGTIRSLPLNNPATPTDMFAGASGMQPFYPGSSKKVGLNIGIDGNLYYVSYENAGKARMVVYTGPVDVDRDRANAIEVGNFVFKMGRASDVRFTLTGEISLRDGGKAEFDILGPDGGNLFRRSVDLRGKSYRVEGFRPAAAGLYICRMSWKVGGIARQAFGRLVVLP